MRDYPIAATKEMCQQRQGSRQWVMSRLIDAVDNPTWVGRVLTSSLSLNILIPEEEIWWFSWGHISFHRSLAFISAFNYAKIECFSFVLFISLSLFLSLVRCSIQSSDFEIEIFDLSLPNHRYGKIGKQLILWKMLNVVCCFSDFLFPRLLKNRFSLIAGWVDERQSPICISINSITFNITEMFRYSSNI